MSDYGKAPKYTIDEDGFTVGPDGGCHASLRAAYHFDLLKLCGCGCPEDAYNFCRAVLQKFDRREARKGGEWINAEMAIAEMIAQDPNTAAHVISHLLDNLELTEHGGSVGGSWLTERGEAIVDGGEMVEADLDMDAVASSTPFP